MRDYVWDIKKGDTIHEFEYGDHFVGIALEDARKQGDGFACTVKDKKSERIVEFFANPEFSAYAPDITIER